MPATPRPFGRIGAAARKIVWHFVQATLGRTVRITLKRAGTCSSCRGNAAAARHVICVHTKCSDDKLITVLSLHQFDASQLDLKQSTRTLVSYIDPTPFEACTPEIHFDMEIEMKKVFVPLFATLFAAASLASDVAPPETPGSTVAQARAEANRIARLNASRDTGLMQQRTVQQPMAQTPGHPMSQGVAEAMHQKKAHGAINDSADQRLEFAHPNH